MIVIGPTPPGTGVIAPATSFTSSYSTSPLSLPFSSGVLPTSITTAPSLTSSFVTSPGRPTALTMTSASLRCACMSFVRECKIVTVAFFCKSNLETGWPTIWLRPITTAFLPSKSISAWLSNSITPSGVQGTKVCSSI